jgi:hypothetical protein
VPDIAFGVLPTGLYGITRITESINHFIRCIRRGTIVMAHLRVNFCPAITGAAAVDLEFDLPHMGHAIYLSASAIDDLE